MSDGDDSDDPAALVTEHVPPALDVTCTAPAPVIEYVPGGTLTEPVPVIEHVSFEHDDTYAAPAPVTEHVAPTSAVTFAAPAPVIKDMVPARAVPFHPVIGYVAPAPDVAPEI